MPSLKLSVTWAVTSLPLGEYDRRVLRAPIAEAVRHMGRNPFIVGATTRTKGGNGAEGEEQVRCYVRSRKGVVSGSRCARTLRLCPQCSTVQHLLRIRPVAAGAAQGVLAGDEDEVVCCRDGGYTRLGVVNQLLGGRGTAPPSQSLDVRCFTTLGRRHSWEPRPANLDHTRFTPGPAC